MIVDSPEERDVDPYVEEYTFTASDAGTYQRWDLESNDLIATGHFVVVGLDRE